MRGQSLCHWDEYLTGLVQTGLTLLEQLVGCRDLLRALPVSFSDDSTHILYFLAPRKTHTLSWEGSMKKKWIFPESWLNPDCMDSLSQFLVASSKSYFQLSHSCC